MENFEFLSSTKIIFGRGVEKRVGTEIKPYSNRILLHYGGGSIKKSGLYDKITQFLKEAGIHYEELSGVQPNPRLSLVREGITFCREQKLDFILAVGGGSVIDSAKAIALGVPYQGDVWDFYAAKATPEKNLPVGVVLTIPAAGSEASKSSVITNENGWYKWGLNVEINRPRFAIMNPELTFTLPTFQTACGAVDIMAHIMERYFTNVSHVDLTDRLCEGALKTMIKATPLALKNPDNYDARAEIMWTGTLAHNDLLGTGRIGDWASHLIEQELSAIYDVAHGAGLAVILPAFMKYTLHQNLQRFVQFAVRVWDVEYDFENPEQTALEGINRLENFYRQIGMPITLQELNIPGDRLEEMAQKSLKPWVDSVGAVSKFDCNDVLAVLKLAQS
jgi:alcohol dehydrogenase YqhD (iron-dependent ADH family)